MRLRRLNSSGIELTRQFLKAVKESNNIDEVVLNGQTFTRSQLITNPSYSSEVSALSDIDLDEARQFETTYDFCEYFDSLIHDHNPQAYREDVGFWTWLAMVYLPQLVKKSSKKDIVVGDVSRLIYIDVYGKSHRHLLATPYYLYILHEEKKITKVPLWHKLHTAGDIMEQVIARQRITSNEAYMGAIYHLYFDENKGSIKPNIGGPHMAGGIRRFVDMVDQIGMTRDFFEYSDVESFVSLLPNEFIKFKK